MHGETDLQKLLASMQPQLHEEGFVFATTKEPYDVAALKPLLQFQEAEGMTLIVTRAAAQAHGLAHNFACRMITLNVHSSLEAVGFLAAIAAQLAAASLGVNPVAGYFHDHLFVPENRAEQALVALRQLAEGQNTSST